MAEAIAETSQPRPVASAVCGPQLPNAQSCSLGALPPAIARHERLRCTRTHRPHSRCGGATTAAIPNLAALSAIEHLIGEQSLEQGREDEGGL